MEPKILTIERAKWRRGGDRFDSEQGETLLLNAQGLMCCLGFDALACGLSREDIFDKGDPEDVIRATDEDDSLPAAYVATRHNNPNISRAISANDNEAYTDAEREAVVCEAMIALGWDDVVFV